MVCLGNICRSPLAEGILRQKIAENGLDWQIDSAGTGSWHVGEQPDRRAIETARQNGVDISGQRARQFQPRDLDDFDLIFTMDSNNYQAITRLAKPGQRDKVKLIMNMSYPDQNRAVPDPYYNGSFQEVFDMLEEACSAIVETYKNRN